MRVKQITSGYEQIEIQFNDASRNSVVVLLTFQGDPKNRKSKQVNTWTWLQALEIMDAINEETRIRLKEARNEGL